MNKKNILMVHNFYQIGGGEHTVYKNEIEMLRENGHKVIEYTRSNDELKESKIKLLLLPFTTIWSVKTYRDIQSIIEKENIDIVHCHNTFPLISPSVYYAARRKDIPVIQTIHNFRFLCPNGSFYCNGKVCEMCNEEWNFKNALKNKCYRGSKIQTIVLVMMLMFHRVLGTYKKISYIFLTEFNKNKFSKLIDVNSDQIFVKPNFVSEKKQNIENKINRNRFVFASRLDENKGILNLIDMWNTLPEKYELLIYGDGPLKEIIESKIMNKKNIFLKGFKPQNEIFNNLSSSCAMLFPSMWYEGFPMIIAESFSVGCPVISSNIGNQKDIIDASNGGKTYDIDSENSFMEAIKDVSLNREKYSQNAIEYFFEKLTKEKNYRRLIDIYDKTRVIK